MKIIESGITKPIARGAGASFHVILSLHLLRIFTKIKITNESVITNIISCKCKESHRENANSWA